MKSKQIFSFLFSFLLVVFVFYYSCTKEKGPLPVKTLCDGLNTKYAAVVLPIIQTNCAIKGCHNGSGGAPGNFNAYEDLKVVADNGKLRDRAIVQKNMPASAPLPDSLIQKIDCWVQRGAQNN